MKLEDKVAIITGAASGIGKAAAFLFAEEGASVVVADIRKGAGEKVVQEIQGKGQKAEFLLVDLRNLSDIQEMVVKTVRLFGKLDILYNNAGVDFVGNLLEISESDWDAAIAINLKSVFFSCQFAVRQMLQQKSGGVIVNTGSVASFVGTPGRAAYDTAKGGVLQLTKSIALDFAQDGIRANCLIPGIIATPMTQMRDVSEEPIPLDPAWQPMGRYGKPEEVARAALFLASDDSSFVTGTALVVDGGYLVH